MRPKRNAAHRPPPASRLSAAGVTAASVGDEPAADWERIRTLPRLPRFGEVLAFWAGERRVRARVDGLAWGLRFPDEIAPLRLAECRALRRAGRDPGPPELEIDLYHATFVGERPLACAGFSFAFVNQCGELTARRSERGRLLCNAEVYPDDPGEGARLWGETRAGGVWGCELWPKPSAARRRVFRP